MIASVRGTVTYVGLDRTVVEVGGVGMLLHTTPGTAAAHRTGEEALFATSLVVREDSLTLFGFGSPAERDMFDTLQSVSGVGPRLALAMLSVMGPEELRLALSGGDTKALTKVPGVGPKSAQRLVLELRDKMGRLPGTADLPLAPTPSTGSIGWRDQVTEALTGLGWSTKQAADAVESVAVSAPADSPIATYLRLALKELRR